jgi:hypothetical protein
MNMLKSLLRRSRAPRGMSSAVVIIIAVVLLLLGWRAIVFVLGAVVGLLRLAIVLGILVVIVLLLAWLIKSLLKKVG